MKILSCFALTLFLTGLLWGDAVSDINSKLSELSKKNIDEDLFSGIAVVVLKDGEPVFEFYDGHTSNSRKSKITSETLFDLASLTKPLCTLAVSADLIQKGTLKLDDPVSLFLPDLLKPVTVKDLLGHTSGLPVYDQFFKLYATIPSYQDKQKALINYANTYPKPVPDKYSDMNYIFAGFIIEKVTGKRLDIAFDGLVKELNYKGTAPLFNPGIKFPSIAATSISKVRGTLNIGTVDDENSHFLEGISGHAGLFASAMATAKWLSFLSSKPWYSKFITEKIGFDVPEGEDSSYGLTAKDDLRGHLGYTGTAFLIDPAKKTIIVILTNRTHPTDEKTNSAKRIRIVRQTVFDMLRSVW
ncbi:MAG TPA: serine hydrolase domain-containing protein [bacterium]|nr:serine hydrolase domain-containing protein [bacterium]